MGFIEKFLNAIKLNDDFDDEEYFDEEDDEEEDLDDYDDDFYERPKTKKRFFSKFRADDDDDEADDYDDEPDEEPLRTRKPKAAASREKTKSGSAAQKRRTSSTYESTSSGHERTRDRKSSRQTGQRDYRGEDFAESVARSTYQKRSKVTPIRRKSAVPGMEVSVIRPSSMEDTREIADTLMGGCTVILNLEGLDVDIAQRVIDFSCGVCYSLEGRLQKVANYIFILTPADVDISGDFQSILSGAFDLSSIQTSY